jgi:hypothetical protein
VSNLIPLKTGTEEHTCAETERKRQLFAWADRLLQELGLVDEVSRATNLEELSRIKLDVDAVEVALAIREALHPASGPKADCFIGLNAGSLKGLLKNRFKELKSKRRFELEHGHGGAGGKHSAHDWTDDLKLDDKGGVRPLLTNLILYLRHHPKWVGVLAYDEFNARVVIREQPPWNQREPSDAPWTDNHESKTRVWFQREDIFATLGDVGRAVQAAAHVKPFHPVREYLNILTWDGEPRLDTWLAKYFHADDSAYARAIGPRYLISAVARIYKPGCQVDHLLVLEGPQGKLKSTALRTLAVKDSWFTDRLSHVASKDAAIEAAGVWIVELAEMDALSKATASAKKSFLTRRFDRFRPPHGKYLVNLPRQCVFAGTINPPAGGYLTDPTARAVSGRSLAAASSTSRPSSATAISFGPRPSPATGPVPSGGWGRPNWRLSPPPSRRHVSRPTFGKRWSRNGSSGGRT